MGTKVYARQINPECQESPLFVFGFEGWENVSFCGNRNYRDRMSPLFERVNKYLANMAADWEDANYSYGAYLGNGRWEKKKKKSECSVAEILRDYGFYREDGKAWNNSQKHRWRMIFERDIVDDDESLCEAMALLTGKKYTSKCIRGCCQSDWQDIYYSPEDYDDAAIDRLEMEYFNTGSEWMIHDGDGEPEDAEDVSGYTTYCYGWNNEGIKKEIAAAAGCEAEDVVLFVHTGYTRVSNYDIA